MRTETWIRADLTERFGPPKICRHCHHEIWYARTNRALFRWASRMNGVHCSSPNAPQQIDSVRTHEPPIPLDDTDQLAKWLES